MDEKVQLDLLFEGLLIKQAECLHLSTERDACSKELVVAKRIIDELKNTIELLEKRKIENISKEKKDQIFEKEKKKCFEKNEKSTSNQNTNSNVAFVFQNHDRSNFFENLHISKTDGTSVPNNLDKTFGKLKFIKK